ncbi:MAG: hypothetical protein WDO71_24085 [Bacteroidota bacterium]
MKKLFIGLLVIAAGAAAFFLMRNKKDKPVNHVQKEWVVGQWELDTLSAQPNDSSTSQMMALVAALDSNFLKYRYDVRRDGSIIRSLNDSIPADTSYYDWDKKDNLLIKESARDSTIELFTVTKLTIDSLLLLSKDSAAFLFTRLK